MRRLTIIVVASVVGGWMIASSLLPADDRTESPADAMLAKLAFPGATRYDDSPGGGGIRHARYAVSDRTADVSEWYRKALDYEGPDGTSSAASSVLFNPIRDAKSGFRASAQYVSRGPGKSTGNYGDRRPLYETVLVKRTDAIVAVVVISRGESEDRTFITLTVIDNAAK